MRGPAAGFHHDEGLAGPSALVAGERPPAPAAWANRTRIMAVLDFDPGDTMTRCAVDMDDWVCCSSLSLLFCQRLLLPDVMHDARSVEVLR